jgi:death-on-curing protein
VSATPDDCTHLTIEIAREIHAAVLKEFGGSSGLRDEGLLASAVFAPQSSFGGKSPYRNLIEIAAAYLFFLCRNHPFVDANKRTAMAAAIVFLRSNSIETAPDGDAWEKLMVDIASSKLDRERTTARLRKLVKKAQRT